MLKSEKPYLKAVDKFALETACEQVQASYDRFFAKLGGFPKFKKKHSSRQTYTTKYTNNNITVSPETIKLPKLGLVALFPKKTNWKRIQSLLDSTPKSRPPPSPGLPLATRYRYPFRKWSPFPNRLIWLWTIAVSGSIWA